MKLKQDGCQVECTKLYINIKLLSINNFFIIMRCGSYCTFWSTLITLFKVQILYSMENWWSCFWLKKKSQLRQHIRIKANITQVHFKGALFNFSFHISVNLSLFMVFDVVIMVFSVLFSSNEEARKLSCIRDCMDIIPLLCGQPNSVPRKQVRPVWIETSAFNFLR